MLPIGLCRGRPHNTRRPGETKSPKILLRAQVDFQSHTHPNSRAIKKSLATPRRTNPTVTTHLSNGNSSFDYWYDLCQYIIRTI